MIKWVKDRIADSIDKYGSIESAANALEMEPLFVELFGRVGCAPNTPGSAALLVKLASDEQEVYSLWQAYHPYIVEDWPQFMAETEMNLSECIAYELLYQDSRYAYIAFMAKKRLGARKKDIKVEYGREGLRMARLLEKLTLVKDAGNAYTYDFSHRTMQRWLFAFAAEGLVSIHEGGEVDMLEQKIRALEELKSLKTKGSMGSKVH